MMTTLVVNGESMRLDTAPDETLLALLRERLRLTGAKRGCDYGVCGACTVLVDGRPVRSCLALAWNCDGRAVTTVEALGPDGALTPLQEAMQRAGGVQCGFCSAAVVLTLHELLERTARADEASIRDALGGVVCRCSGYAALVEAALEAANATRTGAAA